MGDNSGKTHSLFLESDEHKEVEGQDFLEILEEQGRGSLVKAPFLGPRPNNGFGESLEIVSSDLPQKYSERSASKKTEGLSEMVSDIRVEASVNRICLTWTWPANSQKVIVVLSYDDFPKQPKDVGVILRHLTKEEYMNAGGFLLETPRNQCHYFTIFTVQSQKGMEDFSEGVRCECNYKDAPTINYEVVNHRDLWGRFKSSHLYLWSKGPAFEAPSMILVKKSKGKPRHLGDGDELLVISEKILLDDIPLQIPFRSQDLNEGDQYILFVSKNQHSSRFKLAHPEN